MSHSIISKYLADAKDHLLTAKVGFQKGNNRLSIGEFQLAGEKAIKAFVLHMGIPIESTYSHRTKEILDKIPYSLIIEIESMLPFLPPGNYLMRWDAGRLGGGSYFVRLWTGEETQVKRVVLVK